MRTPQTEFAQRLVFFLLLAILCLGSVTTTFALTRDPQLRVATAFIAALVAVLGGRVALYSSVTANRVRLTALLLTAAVCLAVINVSPAGAPLAFVNAVLLRTGVAVPIFPESQPWVLAIAILAMVAVASVVALTSRQQAAMGRPPDPIEDILPKAVTNKDRLHNLKNALRDHLDSTDRSTQWNDANYVPLQAQVQILEGRTLRPKVVDLLNALRSDQRTRIFLILGDPGAGKSVAMRKLSRDLLRESGPTDRIPVYINLKEWRPDRVWARNAPPTSADFDRFVRKTLFSRLDLSLSDFLLRKEGVYPDTFDRLREGGFFFFVMDSFDEIPAVLDQDENSWLIEELSDIIAKYMVAGRVARGVVASRLFRQPKIVHQERSVYQITPFPDERVVTVIEKLAHDPTALKLVVLTKRPDLGVIARNPLLLNLLIVYFNQTLAPPDSQKAMFESYFKKSLDLARDLYDYKDLTDDQIFSVCEHIARIIFTEQTVGLEIPERELRQRIEDPELERVLDFLVRSRIGRLGLDGGAFSFSHRRFNEYFLVRGLEAGVMPVPLDAIQTDSRWRDALVLYAEIASGPQAEKLADHAWRYAQLISSASLVSESDDFIEGRRALRFLIEGFRNRSALLSQIRPRLGQIVDQKLSADIDHIEKKVAIEAIALLDPPDAHSTIVRVLGDYSGWLSEGAATAARYLPVMDGRLSLALYHNCVNRPGFRGLGEARRQAPILTISESTAHIGVWLRRFRLDILKSIITFGIIGGYSIWSPGSEVSLYYIISVLGGLLTLLIFALPPLRVSISKVTVHLFTLWLGIFVLLCVIKYGVDLWNAVRQVGRVKSENGWALFGCFTIALAGLVPTRRPVWIRFASLISEIRVMLRQPAILTKLIPALAVQAVGWIIVYWMISRFDLASRIFVALIGVFAAGFFLVGLLVTSRDYMTDYLTLRRARKAFEPTRRSIAFYFVSLKTSFYRTRYVAWLEQVSVLHYEALRNPANKWPGDKRPQLEDDEASSELARLEAKWLDLD